MKVFSFAKYFSQFSRNEDGGKIIVQKIKSNNNRAATQNGMKINDVVILNICYLNSEHRTSIAIKHQKFFFSILCVCAQRFWSGRREKVIAGPILPYREHTYRHTLLLDDVKKSRAHVGREGFCHSFCLTSIQFSYYSNMFAQKHFQFLCEIYFIFRQNFTFIEFISFRRIRNPSKCVFPPGSFSIRPKTSKRMKAIESANCLHYLHDYSTTTTSSSSRVSSINSICVGNHIDIVRFLKPCIYDKLFISFQSLSHFSWSGK